MNIDRLAGWYRWFEYAAFGMALERRRFAFLDRLAGAQAVLVLGEGDGRALARLLSSAPMARFDVVDASAEMLALARRRTGNSERVRFLCQDARAFDWPTEHYDAIVTFFFLDCFGEEDARRLIQRMEQALAPSGIWLVSEFAIPETGWRRWHAEIWILIMYRFFRTTTGLDVGALPPINRLLIDSGMHRVGFEHERGGMIVSEVWMHGKVGFGQEAAKGHKLFR